MVKEDSKRLHLSQPLDDCLLQCLWIDGVLLSGESRQPVLVHVNDKRVVARHQNVNPKVILVAINEVRFMQILRNDETLSLPRQLVFRSK